MPWRRARFKDQLVYAEVDASGAPLEQGGRVAIRYSPKSGATLYRTMPSRLAFVDGAAPVDLPDGTDPDKAGDSTTPASAPAKPSKVSAPSGFGSAGTRTASQAQAAAADAKARIERLSGETVRCFTDGSCKGNPGPAGSGVLMVLPDGRKAEVSRSLGRATNNIAELTAIEIALDLLDEASVARETPVVLFTDSKYADGVLTRGWKAKANTDLVLSLRARLRARPSLRIQWVAGHVGVDGNERADALANRGVEGVSHHSGILVPEGASDP